MCILYKCGNGLCTWFHGFFHEPVCEMDEIRTRYVDCGCFSTVVRVTSRPLPRYHLGVEALAWMALEQRASLYCAEELVPCENFDCDCLVMPDDPQCPMCECVQLSVATEQ